MYKAYIVDDEPFVRARLKELIDWKALGFSISGDADNGEDGYRDIVSRKPDLVLTDIRMPVFSGLELIRKVIPLLPDCRFIIFSGYSDFEYAHEAIKYGVKSYLLKPVNMQELEEAVLNVREELDRERRREDILDRSYLALGEKWAGDAIFRPGTADILKRAGEMGLNIDNSAYTVMIVDWEEEGDTPDEELEDEMPVRSLLMRKVIEEALQSNGKSFIVHDGYNRYVILHMFPKTEARSMKTDLLAGRLLDKCNEIWKGHVTLGYSDIVTELSSVTGCYKRANVAIEGKFVLGKNRAIGFHHVMRNMEVESWNKVTDWNRAALESAIQSLDRVMVKKETEKLFGVVRELIQDPGIIRGIIAESLAGAIRILVKMDGDVGKVLDNGFNLDEWLGRNTLVQLERQFYDYCTKIMDYLAWVRDNRPKRTIGQIMAYVQSHYPEDMTLKSISGVFFMNPAYLGQLFKSETGVLFHQYLMETRMKAAQKMLMETDLMVGEIAEKCGYKVIRNFYNAFRKYFKCTPNEYRGGKRN